MRRVYTHDNPALVGLAKSLLENAGLEVTIKNEFAAVGMQSSYMNQELWVLDDSDYDNALEILESLAEED